VPIVFAIGSHPVRAGLVATLNRPGGNITGVNVFSAELGAKRLELLRQVVPKATTMALHFSVVVESAVMGHTGGLRKVCPNVVYGLR
jgi:ABC-type uncharacterized transport system substrate-binding protein